MRFGEQIAVLDGVSIDPSDGANYQGGSAYPDNAALPLLPSSNGLASFAMGDLMLAQAKVDQQRKRSVAAGSIDPSDGANYQGGSTYPDIAALPLLPSSNGLASYMAAFGAVTIDPSDGANYKGGSSYPDNAPLPLLTSTVGLADAFLEAVGAKKRISTSGDMLTDARRKLKATFDSLRGVMGNSRETTANRTKARNLYLRLGAILKKKVAAKRPESQTNQGTMSQPAATDPWR